MLKKKKKKNVLSKNIQIRVDWGHKLVPEGLGNFSLDLLDELFSDISSTKTDISNLHSRKLLEITAKAKNVTRSAYQDKRSFNT